MKNILFILSYLSLNLFGIGLDEVIKNALEKNPSLHAIEHKISANKSSIAISNQFLNPTLSYSQNTLDASEAMSQKNLTLTQKITFYGKRDSLENESKAEEAVLHESLIQAKVNLVNAIKNQAYTIWELKELYKIICDYEDITRQNIELSESYTSTSDNQHMGIMSAELTLSDLRIQKSTLKAKISTAYAELSYLASFEIDDLDLALHVNTLVPENELAKGLVHNHLIQIKEKEVQQSKTKVESADLNNYPDITLLGGYAYRENFNDFWNFAVGMSLPIYGTEDSKEEQLRKISLSLESVKEDTQIAITSEFKTAYAQMRSAYEIYHIVHDEALPQIEHMFELSNASISTGADLFKYIDILIQKLKLEQKSIHAVTLFHRSSAKISALSGELQ